MIQRLDDGAWRFIKRNGEALEACAPGRTRPLAHWTQLVEQHEGEGLDIDERTAATRWRGERMDHGIAIELLIARARRAGTFPVPVANVAARNACLRRSAETSAFAQERPRQ